MRDETDAGAERHERWRRIGGRDSHAIPAAGRDPANDAVFFHAEVDSFAPLITLVVIVAACVEAEIAAKRGHIANLRCSYLLRGLRQRGGAVAEAQIGSDVGQREAGA